MEKSVRKVRDKAKGHEVTQTCDEWDICGYIFDASNSLSNCDPTVVDYLPLICLYTV